MPEEVSPENWRELEKKALEKGKYVFALNAFEKIGDREGIPEARQRLREIMKEKEA